MTSVKTHFESLRLDLFYSLRAMAKNRGFAVTAALILALGIGGNTAMFTVIRAVLLRPLAYHDPDRLVFLSVESTRQTERNSSFALTQFQEMKASAKTLEALGAYGRPENVALASGGDPEELKAARVSANFLDVLGVAPQLGRSFLEEEDKSGGRLVAMISDQLWKRRFHADPGVVGMGVALESSAYTIIGVLPQGFSFPYDGVDVWVSRPSEWSMLPPRYWGIPILSVFGRLKNGVSAEQAGAEMSVFQRQYDAAHPSSLSAGAEARIRVVPLKDRLVANLRPMLWTLFGAVGFVLLIACANVASLLLARATSRSREFAVRSALGAGRGRLIRQLLVESVVLAMIGGAIGVLVAWWALLGIARMNALLLPGGVNALVVPGAGEIHLDGVVLGFTIVLSVATGVLFGLFPSLHVSRADLNLALRDRAGSSSHGGPFRVSPRNLLVTMQIALSMMLLIGAALLIESFYRLQRVDPGFSADHLLTAKIALPRARYDSDEKREAFFQNLLPRLHASGELRNAALAMLLPTTAWVRTNITDVEGSAALDPNDQGSYGVVQSASPAYFGTLGIPLKRGREFTARDDTASAPPVVIINETLARRLWPAYPAGVNPVGLHIKEGYDKALGWMEVVGIVADIHEGGLAGDPVAEFYLPLAKHPPQTVFVLVRSVGNPLRLTNMIRDRVRAVDQDQPISDVRTMETVFDSTLGQRRASMILFALFSCVAVLLAAVGIYGVIAYSVSQRAQEIGVRRALGAKHTDILRLILGQGFALALAGIALGVGGALAMSRVMKSMLFHIEATDPLTFGGIGLLFVVVALAASYLPARKAARLDPMAALRVG